MCQINMGAESSCTSWIQSHLIFCFNISICVLSIRDRKKYFFVNGNSWPITMLSKNNCNISIEGRADHPKCSIITGIGGPRTSFINMGTSVTLCVLIVLEPESTLVLFYHDFYNLTVAPHVAIFALFTQSNAPIIEGGGGR